MKQPELISAELQKFIDFEFAKLSQDVAQAFEAIRTKQAAEKDFLSLQKQGSFLRL